MDTSCKEIASFSAMGQTKIRLLEVNMNLRLELLIDGDWSCQYQTWAIGQSNRVHAFQAFNDYVQRYSDNFKGLDLVS
jgi:hypothetical protein